jgi:type II secretory pathway pseudopilin PulG
MSCLFQGGNTSTRSHPISRGCYLVLVLSRAAWKTRNLTQPKRSPGTIRPESRYPVDTQTPTITRRAITTAALRSTGGEFSAQGARRSWTSEQGLSLVEVTIMLVILLILAGSLVPVLSDSISGARSVRARNDLSQMAVALVNFQRDVGPVVFDGTRLRQIQTATTAMQPVLLLMSQGAAPAITDRVPVESVKTLLITPGMSFDAASVAPWVTTSAADLVDNHLRVNGHSYPEATSGPGTGWNGPYLTKEVSGDPWGHAYLINTGFLRGLPSGVTGCSRCAVYVLSAGPNGMVETPFQQPIANANVFGDDLAVRIQ